MKSEWNLSDRIEQLRKELKDNAGLNNAQIDGIIRMILFMDREFIRRLKEEVKKHQKCALPQISKQIIRKIDELAGEKLIVPQDPKARSSQRVTAGEGVDSPHSLLDGDIGKGESTDSLNGGSSPSVDTDDKGSSKFKPKAEDGNGI